MSRRMEIQVGVTVVVALVALLWGVTWLKDLSLQRQVRVWHVRFPQTGGLGPSDEVQVNGMRKGAVSKVELVGDHVVVDLALDKEIRVTRQSVVAIRNVGLMGEKVIAVDLSLSGPEYAPEDTIPGVFEMGMGEVMAGFGSQMGSVDRVVKSLDALTARLDRNGDVDKTMTNLRETSEQLAAAVKENRAMMHEAVKNAAEVSKTARDLTAGREKEYRATLEAIDRSTRNFERLTVRMDSLMTVARSVTDKIDHGNGSAALMLNDRKLYDDLQGSLKALKEMVEDMKKNPRKYINLRIF